jgi:hypothetical protein
MFQLRMFTAWRRAAVVALIGGVAIATQLAAVVPAQAAAPTITIAAASKNKPVTGDVYVVYVGGSYSSATIHGTMTGAAAGEVATLYAQRFPYTKAPAPVHSVTLSGAGTRTYSFTVTPTLATRYKVKLSAKSTLLATSPTKTVYVLENGYVTGGARCGRPVCKETFHLYTVLPGSALSVEMRKHLYPYFGLNLAPVDEPPPPTWLYLNGGHASVSAARRITAGEFENTITFTFTIGNDAYYWAANACTKDTVSTDGLGLPGYHGCGASKVLRTAAYLG